MTYHIFPEDRALVIETNDPVLLLQKVPTAFQLTPTIAGMPHGIDEVTRRALGRVRCVDCQQLKEQGKI